MQPFTLFFLCQERHQTSSFFSCSVCIDGGPEQGGNINYASSSSTASKHALSNSHSCECIGPLRVSNQSEHNLHNSAQRSWQQLCKHANIRRTGPFLSLVSFSCYAKVWANPVCPPSPSGSHRLNDLSMLAWSTHCDEECVRVKGVPCSPFMVALHRLRDLQCNGASAVLTVKRSGWREQRFGSPKGSGFAWLEQFASGSMLQWGLCGNKGSRKLYHVLFGA